MTLYPRAAKVGPLNHPGMVQDDEIVARSFNRPKLGRHTTTVLELNPGSELHAKVRGYMTFDVGAADVWVWDFTCAHGLCMLPRLFFFT